RGAAVSRRQLRHRLLLLGDRARRGRRAVAARDGAGDAVPGAALPAHQRPPQLLRGPLQGLLDPRPAARCRPRLPGGPRPTHGVPGDPATAVAAAVQAATRTGRRPAAAAVRPRARPTGRWTALAPGALVLPAARRNALHRVHRCPPGGALR